MVRTTTRWILALIFSAVLAGPGALAQQPAAPAFKDTTALPGGFSGINSQLDIYIDSGYIVAAMCNYDSGASPLANTIGRILARVKK